MKETLQTAMKKLRLSGMAQSLDVRLQEAAGHSLDHAEFLELLLQDELAVRGDRLQVQVDGATAWEGPLPAEALELRGPPGLRSDNARFEFELAAPGAEAPGAGAHGG